MFLKATRLEQVSSHRSESSENQADSSDLSRKVSL